MTCTRAIRAHRRVSVAAILVACAVLLCAGDARAQLGGTAGAFTRLGFGARGQGMGNAMSSVTTGIISSHYNPALTPFQKDHVLYGNYGILSLDRKLNQISYTQSITLRRKGAQKFAGDPDAQSIAGVSAGWINAGDADIQGYDSDGFKTEKLGVFENQFFLNFGNRFSERFSAGFNVKFYYSGLYDGVTSAGFGLDLGALYIVTDRLTVSFVAQEILTKYKWDTGSLYGAERGKTTENPFARIFRAGGAYRVDVLEGALVAAEAELYDGKTVLARAGAEVQLVEQLALRAGVERIAFTDNGVDPRPTFGVSFS
ncbi:MAG: hypothetical protein IPP94_16420 [Ignavibacteria bacterium]|nr:hypothetical protein [Ignavibacteria bacterium]